MTNRLLENSTATSGGSTLPLFRFLLVLRGQGLAAPTARQCGETGRGWRTRTKRTPTSSRTGVLLQDARGETLRYATCDDDQPVTTTTLDTLYRPQQRL